jgi:hypothetical protein
MSSLWLRSAQLSQADKKDAKSTDRRLPTRSRRLDSVACCKLEAVTITLDLVALARWRRLVALHLVPIASPSWMRDRRVANCFTLLHEEATMPGLSCAQVNYRQLLCVSEVYQNKVASYRIIAPVVLGLWLRLRMWLALRGPLWTASPYIGDEGQRQTWCGFAETLGGKGGRGDDKTACSAYRCKAEQVQLGSGSEGAPAGARRCQ